MGDRGPLGATTSSEDVGLKLTYPTEAGEREAFDAMIAHFFDLLAEEDRLVERRTDAELRERTRSEVP